MKRRSNKVSLLVLVALVGCRELDELSLEMLCGSDEITKTSTPITSTSNAMSSLLQQSSKSNCVGLKCSESSPCPSVVGCHCSQCTVKCEQYAP